MAERRQAPAWFTVASALAFVWGAAGCFAFYMQVLRPPSGSDYDRALAAAMPGSLRVIYAVAVLSGLAGALALLTKNAWARSLFVVSLIAVVLQFGYVFLETDLLAQKGWSAAVPPVGIALIAALEIALATHAIRRDWIA